jgi:hypothetical protein
MRQVVNVTSHVLEIGFFFLAATAVAIGALQLR